MSLNMTEKQAREFFASINRPYPVDETKPDPRTASAAWAAVEAALAGPAEAVQPASLVRREPHKAKRVVAPRAPRMQRVQPVNLPVEIYWGRLSAPRIPFFHFMGDVVRVLIWIGIAYYLCSLVVS